MYRPTENKVYEGYVYFVINDVLVVTVYGLLVMTLII